MNKFKELQNKHLGLLDRFNNDQSSEELVSDVEGYIEEVKIAGKEISASRERNQLRANLRFWGAFIYDQSGEFPDINLWPSSKKKTVRKPIDGNIFPRVASIIGGVGLFLIIIFLAGYFLIYFPQQRASQLSEQNTLTTQNATQNAQIIKALTATGIAFAPTRTPEPTVISLLAPPTQLTPSPTSPPRHSPTPTGLAFNPTSTPLVLIPVTGGGLGTEIEYNQADCSNRTLAVNIYDALLLEEPAIATLFQSDTGDVVLRREIPEDDFGFGSIEIALKSPIENTTYLLQVNNSTIQYELIILQFLSNCTRNNTSVTLVNPMNISEQPFDSELILMSWGSSYTENLWLAKFRLENFDTGFFWFAYNQNQDEQQSELIYDTFIVSGNYCEPIKFKVFETTGGILKEQDILLFSPMSFCVEN